MHSIVELSLFDLHYFFYALTILIHATQKTKCKNKMQNKEDCMAQLDCNVKSCCHNEDNCCCLSSIEVNGSNACNCEDTCCGSYFEDKSGEKNSAQTPHVSLSIACQATNCMYNDDKVCHADHVDISGIRATAAHETVCATFQEK